MKTVTELKNAINFCQTNEFFYEYLQKLVAAGVITLTDGDVDTGAATVSDDLFGRLLFVFGIDPTQE